MSPGPEAPTETLDQKKIILDKLRSIEHCSVSMSVSYIYLCCDFETYICHILLHLPIFASLPLSSGLRRRNGKTQSATIATVKSWQKPWIKNEEGTQRAGGWRSWDSFFFENNGIDWKVIEKGCWQEGCTKDQRDRGCDHEKGTTTDGEEGEEYRDGGDQQSRRSGWQEKGQRWQEQEARHLRGGGENKGKGGCYEFHTQGW